LTEESIFESDAKNSNSQLRVKLPKLMNMKNLSTDVEETSALKQDSSFNNTDSK